MSIDLLYYRKMDASVLASIQFLQRQAASLLLYTSIFDNEVGQFFLILLETLRTDDSEGIACLKAYSQWFQALVIRNISWQEYLITQILKNDNPFTQQAQQGALTKLPPVLLLAAQNDLKALQNIYKYNSEEMSKWVQEIAQIPVIPVTENQIEKNIFQQHEDWANALPELATYYQQYGIGIFAEYHAFRWYSGQLVGISAHDTVRLQDLAAYDYPRQILLKNTEFLLAGYPALNVLLYGSRGTGKSSLVKALLNEYSHRHLRLIEVAKSDLKDLPLIIEQLRNVPQKFIIFVDDLSFEEDDDAFKSLKVVLEGNITAKPQNIVVYATSNRRHLIREFFNDRPHPSDAEEINSWDTVQEKLSFSDRFGLTLTFEPADQNTYLEIVHHLAKQYDINISKEDLEFQALQWATRHHGRSGRTARQFIDFIRADLAVSN